GMRRPGQRLDPAQPGAGGPPCRLPPVQVASGFPAAGADLPLLRLPAVPRLLCRLANARHAGCGVDWQQGAGCQAAVRAHRRRLQGCADAPLAPLNPSAPGATAPNSRGDSVPCHELSFEYLVAPDSLKWFRINTHQAVLLSLCLQSVVDEVVMKKAGGQIRTPADRDRGRDPADLNDFVDRQRPFTRRVGGAEDHQSLAQRLAHWSAADSAAGAAATVADNDSFVHAIGDDDL
ncbi:hypothetical protein BOX15_Mlig027803g1, partial [Macrostomum lignano]